MGCMLAYMFLRNDQLCMIDSWIDRIVITSIYPAKAGREVGALNGAQQPKSI